MFNVIYELATFGLSILLIVIFVKSYNIKKENSLLKFKIANISLISLNENIKKLDEVIDLFYITFLSTKIFNSKVSNLVSNTEILEDINEITLNVYLIIKDNYEIMNVFNIYLGKDNVEDILLKLISKKLTDKTILEGVKTDG